MTLKIKIKNPLGHFRKWQRGIKWKVKDWKSCIERESHVLYYYRQREIRHRNCSLHSKNILAILPFFKGALLKKGSIFLCSLRTLFLCLHLHNSINRTIPFIDCLHCLIDLVLLFVLGLSSLVFTTLFFFSQNKAYIFCVRVTLLLLGFWNFWV